MHDHRVWGLVGILRGAELSTSYAQDASGKWRAGEPERLEPGRVVAVSPSLGDVHEIANAYVQASRLTVCSEALTRSVCSTGR